MTSEPAGGRCSARERECLTCRGGRATILRPDEQGDLIEYGKTSRGGLSLRILGLLIVLLVVVNIAALFVPPPINEKEPGAECSYPVCFIDGTLHFPRPHVVWVAGGEEASGELISTQLSLTDSLLTMILITVLVLVVGVIAARRRADVPGRVQNFLEWAYESLSGFGHEHGRQPGGALHAAVRRLLHPHPRLQLERPRAAHRARRGLRAPTSDLNMTIGLALVAFFTFHIEGVRRLGARGYLCKFFPFYEFRTASARASSPSSWASWSCCSSSSSR